MNSCKVSQCSTCGNDSNFRKNPKQQLIRGWHIGRRQRKWGRCAILVGLFTIYVFFFFSSCGMCESHSDSYKNLKIRGWHIGRRGSAEVWGVPSWLGSSHLLVPSWLIPSQPPGAGHSQTNSHSLQCDFHSWTKQTWIQIEIQIRKHKIYKFLSIWFPSGQSRDSYIQKNYSICHNRQCQCHDFTNWITTKIFNKISL